MAKYMIHSTPKRWWYVERVLFPSMIEQGISASDIRFFNDTEGLGNLRACQKSFERLSDEGGTWHLQDDVVLCQDFKERTEALDEGIVCGFTAKYWYPNRTGHVIPYYMWYSFPCIRIPNAVAKDFAKWIDRAVERVGFRDMVRAGKGDDEFFRNYILETYDDLEVLNVPENLVEHIDWLVGGSTVNSDRLGDARSAHWTDRGELKRVTEQIERIKGEQ